MPVEVELTDINRESVFELVKLMLSVTSWLTETEALSTEVTEAVPLRGAVSDKDKEAGALSVKDALRSCERLRVSVREKLFVVDSSLVVLQVSDCVSVGVNSTEGESDRLANDVAVYVLDILRVASCESVVDCASVYVIDVLGVGLGESVFDCVKVHDETSDRLSL